MVAARISCLIALLALAGCCLGVVTGGTGDYSGGATSASGGESTGGASTRDSGWIMTADGGFVCKPGPNGDVNGSQESSFPQAQWSQQGYACTAAQEEDGGTGALTSCIFASDCPSYCCPCPSDCASFTAQACAPGGCPRQQEACDLALVLSTWEPALCPNGGHAPSEVLGALGFTVAASGQSQNSNYTVILSRTAPADCSEVGPLEIHVPGLYMFFVPGEDGFIPGFYQIGGNSPYAILVDPS